MSSINFIYSRLQVQLFVLKTCFLSEIPSTPTKNGKACVEEAKAVLKMQAIAEEQAKIYSIIMKHKGGKSKSANNVSFKCTSSDSVCDVTPLSGEDLSRNYFVYVIKLFL